MKRTPLTDRHEALDARIVDFAGFAMPVSYSGILEEHHAVRTGLGVFDLSHMGEFHVEGAAAGADVDRLVTNDVSRLEVGQALYTPMCREDGGIVDDLLVYRVGDVAYLLVVNASNIDKDAEWVRSHLSEGTRFEDRSDDTALIAVQGPKAVDAVDAVFPGVRDLASFTSCEKEWDGRPCRVSRTGYTGEDGFEVYLPGAGAGSLWDRFVADGATPIGLGARDTLRFEAKLLLYGNDIDETTTPLEAGIGWTVKFKKDDFIGKTALKAQKAEGVGRKLVGFKMIGKGVPRHGYEVLVDGDVVSRVASGTHSPTFRENLGLAYVPPSHATVGSTIGIRVRNRNVDAEIVKTPFYKRS